ncbi:unnamed protein product [Acanthoscelides obtectus]|uniref:Uncharacterized protein n=1 Tax=Acanthoscelides obtectus TaxID=200917 RepID=A0A9P0PPU0_ACAOB|nr:unnamed protein product [Acanthoscelides obtectus]CAK1655750.1 hypothetical protein AOBTE_LOCUS19300 [Acanthoscelides obtectus]
MSNTLTVTGYTSKLSANFYPPIELDISAEYGLGLIGFYSYNTMYNIHDQHNKISLTHEGDEGNVVTLPEGVYEIEDINKYIQHEIISMNDTYKERYESKVDEMFSLKANTNTLKCELHSVFDIALSNSMATLLGFKNKIFPRCKIYTSHRRQFIDNITLEILDDVGNLVNFRGEKITVKLELRRLSSAS